jgi:hypothetical protein
MGEDTGKEWERSINAYRTLIIIMDDKIICIIIIYKCCIVGE